MIYKVKKSTREMKINFKDATSLVLLKDILILNKYKIFARVDNGRDITFIIEVEKNV